MERRMGFASGNRASDRNFFNGRGLPGLAQAALRKEICNG